MHSETVYLFWETSTFLFLPNRSLITFNYLFIKQNKNTKKPSSYCSFKYHQLKLTTELTLQAKWRVCTSDKVWLQWSYTLSEVCTEYPDSDHLCMYLIASVCYQPLYSCPCGPGYVNWYLREAFVASSKYKLIIVYHSVNYFLNVIIILVKYYLNLGKTKFDVPRMERNNCLNTSKHNSL